MGQIQHLNGRSGSKTVWRLAIPSRMRSLLYVATSGLVDDVPLEHVRPFALGFAGEMEAEHPDVVAEIESTGTLSGPAVECIRAALADAKKRGSATWQA